MHRYSSNASRLTLRYKLEHAGFTLLELLVVLLIIGLLVGFVGPKYFDQIGRSEQRVAKAQIDAFQKALYQYRVDTGKFPSTEQGLPALLVAPADEPKWHGPYLAKEVPLDPWGRSYDYKSPGAEQRDFDIVSYGKDGTLGGTAEADADIRSWD